MAAFASDEWIQAFDEALGSSQAVAEATRDVQLTIRQTVTGHENGDVSWHIVVDHGVVRAHGGAGDHADVTFTEDYEIAQAIASGTVSVQSAFMVGRLTIGGDTSKLMEYAPAFDGIADVFDDLRAATTY